MDILDALRFVQGAVARKGAAPELTHFRIRAGRITGYNGRLLLSSVIPIDFDCCPAAAPLIKAIQACEETAQLHMTPNNRLAVRSGSFRAHVDTIPDVFPDIPPQGVTVKVDGKLLPILQTLYKITSDDEGKTWANGILFDGYSAYASNNVILIETWLGYHFPFRINVPKYAIKELLRIGKEPSSIVINAQAATFYFGNEQWLTTQLLTTEWPDVQELFGIMAPTKRTVPKGFFAAVDKLAQFVGANLGVYLLDNALATSREAETTAIDVPGVKGGAVFNVHALLLLDGIATLIGVEEFPRPVPFYGEGYRGLIAGLRT